MASIDAPQIRPDATLVRLLWVSTLVLPLVLQRESRKRVWEGEDDMGVPDRQQLAFTLREPLIARVRQTLRAMPIATRVERDGAMPAGGTPIEMPTQRCRPAVCDGAKQPPVLRGEPGAMSLDEAGPGLANDVGHLKGYGMSSSRYRRFRVFTKKNRSAETRSFTVRGSSFRSRSGYPGTRAGASD